MKILILFLLFTSSTFSKAQTISASYFKIRTQYWSQDFKASLIKNGLANDTMFNDVLKNGALREENNLKYLFDEYLKREGKNLDTASSLFFLKKRVHMKSEIVIWNSTDTIYAQTAISFANNKEPEKIKFISFNDEKINKTKNYILQVMNMVSKVNVDGIQDAINEKTFDKNGKLRFVLDGSSFELYNFKRIEGEYKVEKFFFMNPKFN